jgi:hypothetical protein
MLAAAAGGAPLARAAAALRGPRRATPLLALVAAIAWGYALAHRATIVP